MGPTCQRVEIGMRQECFGPYARFICVHRPDSGPMRLKDVENGKNHVDEEL